MRKFLVICLCLITITGCSSHPDSFKGIEHPRSHKVNSLVGLKRGEIHQKMGQPISSRGESDHILWSYRHDTCSTLVYFNKDGICQHAETRGICE